MKKLFTGEELEQLYYTQNLDLNTLSIEDLIVLSDYLGETELNAKQLSLLEKCLDVISKFPEYSINSNLTIKENTWNDILQKYEHNSSIKHTRKPNSLKKVVISIIAATISLLGISTVVCNANGINLFNIFFNKNTGVASTNQNVSVNTIQDAYYDNLKTFLSEHTEVILPSYLPNEYIFDNSTYHLDDTKKEYSTVFSNSNNIIRVIQTTYLNEELLPYTNYEVDGTLIEEYYYNQITFNIYSNKDRFTAIWIIDNTSYTINTSVTIDELKNIINSMYKGEN